MKNVLEKLVMNSRKAIDDGIYDITETLPKSEIDLEESIKNNVHASLIYGNKVFHLLQRATLDRFLILYR